MLADAGVNVGALVAGTTPGAVGGGGSGAEGQGAVSPSAVVGGGDNGRAALEAS